MGTIELRRFLEFVGFQVIARQFIRQQTVNWRRFARRIRRFSTRIIIFMKRAASNPRPDWQIKVEKIGLTFHTLEGVPYWDESACYVLTSEEVDELEAATNTLQEVCIQCADRIVRENLYERLRIPEAFRPLIQRAWDRDDPTLYGRFDLAYAPGSPPKLLEYNADTPTSLLESAVAQWDWLQELHPELDQFNSIHERLIKRWSQIRAGGLLHFASMKEFEEDLRTVEYMMDTATQAKHDCRHIFVEDIGWNGKQFLDLDNQPIRTLFKLYPWEWLIHDEFGKNLLNEPVRLIEPAWKMLLSNKAVLPLLWEMFPGHPNLLPAYTTPQPLGSTYVRKPLLSREGSNVTIRRGEQIVETDGDYGEEGFIYQQFFEMPSFNGNYPVLGSWIIEGESAGIGIREDTNLISGNFSRFVPHLFVP